MKNVHLCLWKICLSGMIYLIFSSTPLRSQTDEDPFQWLEDVEGEEQLAWVNRHNTVTLDYITHIKNYKERYNFVYNILTSNELLIYPERHNNGESPLPWIFAQVCLMKSSCPRRSGLQWT